MRMLTRSIPVAALALCLSTGPLLAQEVGSSNLRWYVGGHGGVTFFGTPTQGGSEMPVGGGHFLIVAKRTGLLLTFDHGFGDNETSSYDFVVVDSSSGAGGAVVNSGTINTTFDGLRKISAVLMAFPIKNDYINPYLGVGVGLLQTTGNEPDDDISSALGSSGFGTLIGGLEFRLSRLTAFGQYQITTKPRVDDVAVPMGGDLHMIAFGRLTDRGTHTLTAGLRFDLGSSREAVKSGGYN
jgi:hypothetical protein